MARLLGEARVSILPDGTRFKTEAEAQIKKAQQGLNAKVQLMLDNKELNAKIADVKAKIADLKRESATIAIDADNKQLIAKVAQAQAVLDRVAARVAKAKVDADISSAMASIASVDASLDKLRNKPVDIKTVIEQGEFNKQVTYVQGRIDRLKQESAVISISTEDKQIIAEMARVQARLDKLKTTVAKAKVEADISSAMATITSVDAALEKYGFKKVSAKADVSTGEGEVKLSILDAMLDKFGLKRVNAKAGVSTGEGETKLAGFRALLDRFGGEAGGAGNNGGKAFGGGFVSGLGKSALMQNPGITAMVIAGLAALPAAVGAVGVLGGIALGAGIMIGAEMLLKKQIKTLTADIKAQTTIANSKTATAAQKKAAQDIIKQDMAQVDALNKQVGAFSEVNTAVNNLKLSFTKFAVVVSKPLIKPFADAINNLSAQLKGPLAKAFTALFKAVAPLIKPVEDALLEIVKGILPGLTDMLTRGRKPLTDLFEVFGKIVGLKVGQWFRDAIPYLKESGTYFNKLVGFLGSAVSWLIKFGGETAKAFGDPNLKGFGGIISKIGSDLLKIVGPAFQGWAEVMAPVVKDLAKMMIPLLNFLAAHPGLVKAITAMAAAFFLAGKAIALVRLAMIALEIIMAIDPFTAVLEGIALAAVLMITHWQATVKFFKAYFPLILGIILPGLGLVVGLVIKYWGPITHFVESVWNGVFKFLKGVWGNIENVFTGVAKNIANWATTAWNKVYTNTVNTWNNVFRFLKGIWGHIENGITGVFKPIASVVEGVWNQAYKMTRDTWGFIYAVIKGYIQIIYGIIVQIWRGIKAVTEATWKWIYNTSKDIWGHIENAITGVVKPLVNWIKGAWAILKSDAERAWNWVFSTAKSIWGHIENTITGIVKPLVDWVKGAWAVMKSNAEGAWNWIYSTAKSIWGHVENVITGIVKPLIDWVKGAWAVLKSNAEAAWNWIYSTAKSIWGHIENVITGIVKPLVSTVSGLWDTLKTATKTAFNWIHDEIISPMQRAWNWITQNFVPGIEGAFTGAVNTVKTIWSDIKGAITQPIQWVIDTVYNGAIVPFWNNTAGVVGATPIHPIKGFASGGKIPGWDNGDRVPAVLEGGEAVVPKRLASSAEFGAWAGYHGIPGFARGGKVGGQGVHSTPTPGSPASQAQAIQQLNAKEKQANANNPGGIAIVTPVWDKIRQLGGDALAAVFQHLINPLLSKIPGFSGGASKDSPIVGMPLKLIKSVEDKLVDWIKGHDKNDVPSGSGSSMLAFMMSQKGKKYSQAARFGPDSWDCSGLVWAAAHAAGVGMPGGPSNNAAAIVDPELQWAGAQGGAKVMQHPSSKDIKAGDLLGFTGSIDDHVTGSAKMLSGFKLKIGNIIANSMGHIGMAMSPSQFMSAYDTAVGCEPEPIDYPNLEVAVRLAGGAAATAVAGSQMANGTAIYEYLLANLFPGHPIAAAGAIASIWGESLWNPEAKGTGGFGLIGWTGNTLGLPAGYHGPTGNATKDLDIQLPGIVGFVKASGDMGTIAQMMKAGSVLEAANLWGHGVERFGINDVHGAGVAAATQIMNAVSQGTPAAAQAQAAQAATQFQKAAATNPAATRPGGGGKRLAMGGLVDVYGASNAHRLAPFLKHKNRNSGVEGEYATRSNGRFPGAIKGTDAAFLWEGYNDIANGVSATAVASANEGKISAAHSLGIPVVLGSLQQGTIADKNRLSQISQYNKWASAASGADAYAAVGTDIPRGQVHGSALNYMTAAGTVDSKLDKVLSAKSKLTSAVTAKTAAAKAAVAAKLAAEKQAWTAAEVLKLGTTYSHAQLQARAASDQGKMAKLYAQGNYRDYANVATDYNLTETAVSRWPSQLNAKHDVAVSAYNTAAGLAQKYLAAGDLKNYARYNQLAHADQAKVQGIDTQLATQGTAAGGTDPISRLANALSANGDLSKIGYQLRSHSLDPAPVGNLSHPDMARLALAIPPDALQAMYDNSPGELATALMSDLSANTIGNIGWTLQALGQASGVHGIVSGKKFMNGGLLPAGAGFGIAGGVPFSFNEGGRRERIVPDRGNANADVVAMLSRVEAAVDRNTQVTQAGNQQTNKNLGGVGSSLHM